uniref:GH18 domain-containing protein n=1 Tax=Vombatus ursinus TaxID=29139 RepID=A0A4X2JY08_VOMUR
MVSTLWPALPTNWFATSLTGPSTELVWDFSFLIVPTSSTPLPISATTRSPLRRGMMSPYITPSMISRKGYWDKDGHEWPVVNLNLKTLLAIGGTKFGSKGFHPTVDSSESRSTIINSVIQLLRHNDFNGLNINWIYPELNENPFFASLIHELAVPFQEEAKTSRKDKLLLSVGVAAGRQKIDNGYEIKDLASDVDFINPLSFDHP